MRPRKCQGFNTKRTGTCAILDKLIIPNEIPDAAVYGVRQYTVDGLSGQDYIAALTVASFREAVAIEDATGAYADVVRVRNKKVEDLGFVLAALNQAIASMDTDSSDPDKKAQLLAALDKFMKACAKRRIPVLAGTELNAPGQLLCDDYTIPELAPYRDQLLAGCEYIETLR